MRLYNLSYFIRESFESIFKHRFMSFAALSVITACLLLMGSFTLVVVNIENMLKDIEDKNEIIAYVKLDYTYDQATALEGKIREIDDISELEFITKERALQDFKEKKKELKDLLDYIDEDNPLRYRYRLKIHDIRDTETVARKLGRIEGIDKVGARSDITDRIIRVRDVVTAICVVLIAILFLVSIFIISNTVNLTIFNRREEIAIMKMVGATDGFVRFPFIIEGLILGIGGAVLSLLLQWSIYEYIASLVAKSIPFFSIISFSDILHRLALIFFGTGILVGGLGSAITLRKFLKV